MFRRLEPAATQLAGHTVRVSVDGTVLDCREGDSLAAALMAGGLTACRNTPVSGALRGPFCMMGVCYDCLVTIDGRANRQACMTPVREGMTVSRQAGAREVEL